MLPVEEVSTVHGFMLAIAPEVIRKGGRDVAKATLTLSVQLTGELAKFRREAFKAIEAVDEADPESYPKAQGTAPDL
jgi:hypothetical protein